MNAWLSHLLAAAYLYETNALPLGGWPAGAPVVVPLYIAGVILAWWSSARRGIPGMRTSLWAWAMGLAFYLARPYLLGPLSARIWHLSAALVALSVPLLAWGARHGWPVSWHPLGRAMACTLTATDLPWSWPWQTCWLALHAYAFYVLVVYEGIGWGPPMVALGCLLLATGTRVTRWREGRSFPLRAEVLAPLLLPYAAYLARWLGRHLLRIQVQHYGDFPLADLWSPWFSPGDMLWAGMILVVLTTFALCWRSGPFGHRWEVEPASLVGWVALLAVASWFVAMMVRHLSHGATGSDPYCYVQMAVDLAERGTALRQSPLVGLVRQLDLPLWPSVPVGYHPPRADGEAAAVWPIGWPLLLAPLYRLGGEPAVLWAAPCCTLLAALFTCLCARTLWPKEGWLPAGLAGCVVLTSREVVYRSLVPMADAAAQALAAVALLGLVRARRHDDLRWSALAGLGMGFGYWVRHPLLPLVLAAIPLVASGWPLRRRVQHAAILGGAMLLGVLPDLWYHAQALGSPWIVESPEAALLSWRHIVPGLALLLQEGWLHRGEYGYLLPLVLVGFWQQARSTTERVYAAIMGMGFLGVVLLSVSYGALRWRDVLALTPWLALWAGYGLARAWAWAVRPGRERTARRAMVLLVLLVAWSARTAWTWERIADPRVSTFGHLSGAQRRAYDQLAAILPMEAVLACGLNAGAITHYAGVSTVRPAPWTAAQFSRLVDALGSEGRPIYYLEDGEEMRAWWPTVGHAFRRAYVGTLNIPTFGAGGEPYRTGAPLFRLEPLLPTQGPPGDG